MKNPGITFIGCGNMGRSLIGGMIANGYPATAITGCDTDAGQRELAAERFGIETMADGVTAVRDAAVVVLAVKPQMMRETLAALQEGLQDNRALLISIAAGIKLQTLADWNDRDHAIVRVMPNTPSLVRTGASALCANANVSNEQRTLAEHIMRSVGIAIWLDDEALMDAVTAISGSGPAYYFYLMEIMQNTARDLGLDDSQSRLLVLQTVLGAAKMALESQHAPGELRQQVTSPGGTTEQALRVLQEGELASLFSKAIHAAHDRSVELAEILAKPKDTAS